MADIVGDALIIDLARPCADWPDRVEGLIEPAVRAALAQLEAPRLGELSVVLSDDAHMRALNRDYRGKDKTTNVLSFPMDPATGLMGDVVLALETVRREAAEQDKPFEHHLSHLLIHGVLHLQGFDHEIDADAEDMEAREVRALASLSIDNPYRSDKR